MSDITVEVVASPAIEVTVSPAGVPGLSAYQLAAAQGFVGTEAEWLDSLKSTGGTANWGDLGGTLSDQTDLQAALDAKANSGSLATVATSGAYADLSGKPTLGTAAGQDSTAFATAAQGAEADAAAPASTVYTKTASDARYATAAQGAKADSAVQPGSLSTVATSGAYSDLTGKPALGTAAALNVPATGNAATGEVVKGTDTRLSDARTPTAHTHTASQVTDFNTAADARVAAGITGKLDTSAAPELIRDTIGTALIAGSNVTITVDDPGDTITISASGGSSKSVQHDTSGGYDYTGVAAQGTSTSASSWTITRTDLSSPTTAAKHATGAWTGRTGLTYS